MLNLTECHENCLCMDCKNKACIHAGSKQADCPKYICDNPKPHDCDHCKFLEEYAAAMRHTSCL